MFKPIIGSVCFSNSFWSLLIINNAIFFIQEKKQNKGNKVKKKQLKNKNKKKRAKNKSKPTYLNHLNQKNLQLPTTHSYTAPRYVFA